MFSWDLQLGQCCDPTECPRKEAPVSMSARKEEVLLGFSEETEWPFSFKMTLGIIKVCLRAKGAGGREEDHQARACNKDGVEDVRI